jgi:uncharacterized protein YjlB
MNTPETYFFADDGAIPNSHLPLLVYRQVAVNEQSADWFIQRFAENNWLNSWTNGILPYHHYHSTTHEVLGIYQGWVTVLAGGEHGQRLTLQTGDVVVIPAGVGHKNRQQSPDLGVAGAYPDGREWDLLTGKPGERPTADHIIAQLPLPTTDPLFGKKGPLMALWQ